MEDENTFKVPEMPKRFKTSSPNEGKSPAKLRRSTRLSLKKIDTSMNTSLSFFDTTQRRQSVRLLEKSVQKLSSKLEKENVNTPAPRQKFTKAKSKTTPRRAHVDHVFNLINNGNEKQLQTLATIGAKTASLIYTYR